MSDNNVVAVPAVAPPTDDEVCLSDRGTLWFRDHRRYEELSDALKQLRLVMDAETRALTQAWTPETEAWVMDTAKALVAASPAMKPRERTRIGELVERIAARRGEQGISAMAEHTKRLKVLIDGDIQPPPSLAPGGGASAPSVQVQINNTQTVGQAPGPAPTMLEQVIRLVRADRPTAPGDR